MLDSPSIKLARGMGHKLCKNMSRKLIQMNYSLRYIPCFLHRPYNFLRKKMKKFPVVIEFESGSYSSGLSDVKKMKCRLFNLFPSISSCSTKLTVQKMEQLLSKCSHIKKIYYDRQINALLDVATPSIHSDLLHQSNLTGKDVTIAILDTGIHPHEDLNDRIIDFKDFVKDNQTPYDDNGHGTHCAGDAVGNGFLSNGKYQGPAPDANVVGVKVLNKIGSGSLSTVIAGIDWCIQHQARLGINVLSLSLGSPAQQSAEDDLVVTAVEKAWDSGMVVCVAAGNEGPADQTISSPGISPKIITVGAVNDQNTTKRSDDDVANFSSRGPTIDGVLKPDLVVPGVNIISLRSPSSYLDKTVPSARVDTHYFSLSGTSMATPICAGVVAQLLQHNLNLTPNQVKEKLLEACEDMGQAPTVQGSGYLDAANLIK